MFKKIFVLFFAFLVFSPIFVFGSILPPSYPTAISDRDGYVPLFWFEPNAQVHTIAYEDEMDIGMVVDCEWYNNAAGVKFTVSQTPFLLHKVKIFISYLPLSCGDYDHTAPFHITLNKDNDDIPGDTTFGPILAQAKDALSDSGEWVEIELNQIIEEEDFWVVFHWLEGSASSPSLGVDLGAGSLRSFRGWKKDGYYEWMLADDFGWRIRIDVVTDNQSYPEANSFRIYRSEDSNLVVNPENIITSLSNSTFQYLDSNLCNGQTYFYKISSLKGSDESSPSNLTWATPRLPANLVCSPDSLFSHLLPNDSEYVNLNLENCGGLPLDFKVKLNIFTDSVIKGADEYGYIWQEGEFNWVDIQNRGTKIGSSGDNNESYGPFHFPFDFPFYENNFDSIFICTNGWMSFTSNETEFDNKELPYAYGPFNLIAPFWDELKLNDSSEIYYFSNDDSLVVSYHNLEKRLSGGNYTFEIILTLGGKITFQYLKLSGAKDSCTVGIQNQDGCFGLNLAYNQSFLEDWLALCVKPGWIDISPRNGNIDTQEDENLEVCFKSGSLPQGVYNGELVINFRDKNGWHAPLSIPLTLEVDTTTGVNPEEILPPSYFKLEQNYPNPFNLSTNIRYCINEKHSLPISLKIYNLKGELVKSLEDISCTQGEHTVIWEGRNNFGKEVASGVYFYKLKVGEFSQVKKMVLIK